MADPAKNSDALCPFDPRSLVLILKRYLRLLRERLSKPVSRMNYLSEIIFIYHLLIDTDYFTLTFNRVGINFICVRYIFRRCLILLHYSFN